MGKKRGMQHLTTARDSSRNFAGKTTWLSGMMLLVWISGCGGNATSSTPPPAAPGQGPQLYFAPLVVGTANGDGSTSLTPLLVPQTYAIDDSGDMFSQTIYPLAPQVLNAGVTSSALPRGLLSLGITVNYVGESGESVYLPTDYTPAKMGSFAVELAGQAGGLVQLVGQPVAPLVAATQCPNQTTPQTYQFLTIPGALPVPNGSQLYPSWNPATQTAYGSADISASGSTITFNSVQQFNLSGTLLQPATSPATGACGPTPFGNTISTPNIVIGAPSGTGQGSTSTQATIGIGPTGLLVEDNAEGTVTTLGAGTGAVGLPKPSSPLGTSALVGAQYLGFVYGAGVFANFGEPPTWTSHLASFGFPSVPSNCASLAASTSTLIYGGDYQQINGQDDPSASASSGGFGNCDLAIDLGTQDASNNGSYPHATVWMGASYTANTTGKTYSFPAVAIASQLNGKNAIFVLGVDSTQPWEFYLLQSN
jgi:hypothetical protein